MARVNKNKPKIVPVIPIAVAVGRVAGQAVVKNVIKNAAKKSGGKKSKAAKAAANKRAAAKKRAAKRKLTPEETGKAPVKKWGPGRLEYEAKKKELGIVTKKYPRKYMGDWYNF